MEYGESAKATLLEAAAAPMAKHANHAIARATQFFSILELFGRTAWE
jgi:hypothetical protein